MIVAHWGGKTFHLPPIALYFPPSTWWQFSQYNPRLVALDPEAKFFYVFNRRPKSRPQPASVALPVSAITEPSGEVEFAHVAPFIFRIFLALPIFVLLLVHTLRYPSLCDLYIVAVAMMQQSEQPRTQVHQGRYSFLFFTCTCALGKFLWKIIRNLPPGPYHILHILLMIYALEEASQIMLKCITRCLEKWCTPLTELRLDKYKRREKPSTNPYHQCRRKVARGGQQF